MNSYNPAIIEPKWQKIWEERGLSRAEDFSQKKKFYLLVEFPYCSGGGLHIGHARPWLPTDALARKKRMDGFNVLFPFGWDAFGLPTENYAIKTGRNPAEITAENIAHFKEQAKSLGLSFDWSREINTSDPDYYKWTQWIFIRLFEKGLAYQAEVPVNWCPACRTNLADEEVRGDGTHERCEKPTEKRRQKQWLLRITKYADRLIDDLKLVDYPREVATQQVNWVGRKEGARIKFKVQSPKCKVEALEVFTTRAETIFGATFVVLSPNHSLAGKVRTVINPATGQEIPVFVDEYVLDEVGTGAIMGVPAHDERDWAFAKRFNLPIVGVVCPNRRGPILDSAYTGPGVLVNSGRYDGLTTQEAARRIVADLQKEGLAEPACVYHLRDWVFSRQHYWGEPIPIIHCLKCGPVAVPEEQLPVELPYLEKYQPSGTGESPLAAAAEWLKAKCPACGATGRRETDTMPNWAGSNWYYLGYLLKVQNARPSARQAKFRDIFTENRKVIDYWMPVDVYEGGFEHTTLHLLYSRFIYKFLSDLGVVPGPEPYAARRVHGILLGADNRKMSKSFGNVIDPMEMVKRYGSDTLRLYEMFIGPFNQQVIWNDRSLAGCYRLCARIYNLAQKKSGGSSEKLKGKLAGTIKKVGGDIEGLRFNTAVAAVMELVNVWEEEGSISPEDLEKFLRMLAPLAPHLAEELWQKIRLSVLGYQLSDKSSSVVSQSVTDRLKTGEPESENRKRETDNWSVHQQPWPEAGEIRPEEEITLAVMVNGKTRGTLTIFNFQLSIFNEEEIKRMAQEKVEKWLEGKKIQKIVFVPGKVVNFVI